MTRAALIGLTVVFTGPAFLLGGMPWLPIAHTRPDVYADIHDDLWVEWAVSDLIDQWNDEEAS